MWTYVGDCMTDIMALQIIGIAIITVAIYEILEWSRGEVFI